VSNQTATNNTVQARRAESGQAIVLMALVMIALLGMLGLAIDGGGLYFLWRDAQNATDAAVLSASYARCTEGNSASVISAGLAAAAKNGFDNNGTTNTVVVANPPTDGEQAGNMDYIQVDISAKKPSYFIQMVYREPLEVTTRAVGYCSPPFDGGQVPGLWAGSTSCQNTANWTGSNGWIEGPMFSNFELKFKGSDIKLEDGEIQAVKSPDGIEDGPKIDYDLPDYPPTVGVPPTEDPLHLDFSLYAPTGAVFENVTLKKALIDPVTTPDGDFKVHQGSNLWSPDKRTLEGLYYVVGSVKIGSGVDFGPQGITIVATGEIDWAGKSDTHYYYEVMKPTANNIQYPGIMLASNYFKPDSKTPCGDNAIKIPGPSSILHGVMYAPNAGVNIQGASMTINGSIIANTIDYSGSWGHLKYDPSILPPRPPSIQVAE
jgi:hypothetical protein